MTLAWSLHILIRHRFCKPIRMKTLFITSIISCSFFIACSNNQTDSTDPANPTVSSKTEKKISARNISIDKTNSYSDLFLDSAAVENFIAEKKADDSIAFRIRSFYSSRNYQFAWFSSNGLTEQARGFWNLPSS